MHAENSSKIKILHLASFSGNTGDFANHQGFYKKFTENIPAEFTQLEMRKFYKNRAELKFDDDFIKLINNYDLLVLGGGAFFDLKWDYSNTGTTIDFSEDFIKKIKTPVLVNAMGYHEFGDVDQQNINKFRNFLNLIINNKKWFISVRNDGTLERMCNRYGELIDENRVLKVPDSGFFFSPKEYSQFYLDDKNETTWIGLNVTNELFNKSFNKDLDVDKFNGLISQFINKVLKDDGSRKVILFPHAHQDVSTIGIIMNEIEDKYRREKIVVAPLFTEGKQPIEQAYDFYRICSCVIGMRFHANVCCVGMNIPTIGLAGHEQISSLYDELGLSKRCVKINSSQFVDELLSKLDSSLEMADVIKKEYSQVNIALNKRAELYHKRIKDWVNLEVKSK